MFMASLQFSISVPPVPKLHNPNKVRAFSTILSYPKCLSRPFATFYGIKNQIASSSTSPATAVAEEEEEEEEETMSISNLHRFIDLNLGRWNGTFLQFDAYGNFLQKVDTKLAASSYGEDELISLIQTLYIKQPLPNTSISGHDEEPEWTEYKIKESNMFTVDKYQQIGFFPSERAFSLRYQTAGMLETVLRQGVLGEDDTGEESPRNLKLPSRRPSIVCENCLYAIEKDMRARAFHIVDPKGILEMFLIFIEERSNGSITPLLENPILSDNSDRITPFLGKWKGHSVTNRSGVYGATLCEADTLVVLEADDNGQVFQDVSSSSEGEKGETVCTNVHWTGARLGDLVAFDGGYQMTLLPGGMYMGCPSDVAKCVREFNSFHLEFCWLETPTKRQRLVRTYDKEGLAVSSTYFSELKL